VAAALAAAASLKVFARSAQPSHPQTEPRPSGRGRRADLPPTPSAAGAPLSTTAALPPPPARPLPPPPPNPQLPVEVGTAYPATQGATLASPGGRDLSEMAAIPDGAHSLPRVLPRVPLPAPSRPRTAERIRARSSGRRGFQLNSYKHAGRRMVAMPAAKPVNRMQVVGNPGLGIASADALHLRRLTKRAATYFIKDTFCKQPTVIIASAIEYLEEWEPRLAVCERSWGACALLSRHATNASEYRTQVAAKRGWMPTPGEAAAALPATLPPPPPSPLPPPPDTPAATTATVRALACSARSA